MKVEIKLKEGLSEPKVIIETNEMTDEITDIIKRLSEERPDIITGFKNGQAEILEQKDIYSIFSANKRIYARTDKGEFALRSRMYELEERLDKNSFVRISNSEIINLKKVEGFDLNLAGTICVKMKNGKATYASRRYVTKIKKLLGI